MLESVGVTEPPLSPRKCSRALHFDTVSSTDSGPSSDEGLIRRLRKTKKKVVAPPSDTSSDGSHGLGALHLQRPPPVRLPNIAGIPRISAPPFISRSQNPRISINTATGPSTLIALTVDIPTKPVSPIAGPSDASGHQMDTELPSDATSASISDSETFREVSRYVHDFCQGSFQP